MNASIKNNVAVSIAHIHVHNKLMVKTLYHAINVTSSEAKFFAIRCDIIQAICSHEISKIIVIMDFIHAAKKIFDLSLHMLQKQAVLILKDLREFFNHHHENIINFWKCLSKSNWKLKQSHSISLPSCQTRTSGISAENQNAMTLSTNER